jgi:hypothetical protein
MGFSAPTWFSRDKLSPAGRMNRPGPIETRKATSNSSYPVRGDQRDRVLIGAPALRSVVVMRLPASIDLCEAVTRREADQTGTLANQGIPFC